MDSDTPSTARGLLMLMLRPIPTFFMEDLDTTDMLDSDTSDMDTLDIARLGYRVYGKRSADAEAKPDPYYLAYGHGYGLGYAGHLGYGHLGYAGLGYGGYYPGK